jgi:hypothetical protein
MPNSRDLALTSRWEGLRLVAHAAMRSDDGRGRQLGEACWTLACAIEPPHSWPIGLCMADAGAVSARAGLGTSECTGTGTFCVGGHDPA